MEDIVELEKAAQTIKRIEEKYDLKYYSSLVTSRLENIKEIINLSNKYNIDSSKIQLDGWGNLKLKDVRVCSFTIVHKPKVLNSQTNYDFNKNEGDYIRLDNGNIGRLMFVKSSDWDIVGDIWNKFNKILLSYNPVDWDMINFDYVYNMENGLKLHNDFAEIYDSINNEMQPIIKQKEIKELEDKLKQLKVN